MKRLRHLCIACGLEHVGCCGLCSEFVPLTGYACKFPCPHKWCVVQPECSICRDRHPCE